MKTKSILKSMVLAVAFMTSSAVYAVEIGEAEFTEVSKAAATMFKQGAEKLKQGARNGAEMLKEIADVIYAKIGHNHAHCEETKGIFSTVSTKAKELTQWVKDNPAIASYTVLTTGAVAYLGYKALTAKPKTTKKTAQIS